MKGSKKTKRLFSVLLVLAMCFTLLPGMTLTTQADSTGGNYSITFTPNADICTITSGIPYDLWVGGVQVTSVNALNVLAGDALNDGKVSYDADTKTLTLSGADIESGYQVGGYKAAVYTTEDLVLAGSGSMGGDGIGFGLHTEGEKSLTINGDFSFSGTLNGIYTYGGNNMLIEGGNVTASGGSNGIFASSRSSITVNGGHVTATGHGGANAHGYGIQAKNLTVNGGTLTATGGTDGNPGEGIAVNAFTVSGGLVTAVGNNSALYAAPTLESNIIAVASSNMDGTDQVPYDASQNYSYKWFRATEPNTELTIGGKSEWEFGDTIEFGSEEFYYIKNNRDRSVYHAKGDATLRYDGWFPTYKEHIIYLYIHPTQYYIYTQPGDSEAETPQMPAGVKLIGGNGTVVDPYEFALWYKYTVNITAGPDMIKISGDESQTVTEGEAITDVVYTADTGCFPDTYSVEAVNGITVTRNSATQITVSGTPTAAATMTLTGPSDHQGDDPVQENVTSATCAAGGSYDLVTYCKYCGVELSREPVYTDPLGHTYGAPVYEWAPDNKRVTATRTCGRDASHIDTETVNTTSELTKPATLTEPGEHTYTAIFTKTGFTKQTKTVADIPVLVPSFTVTFNANGGTVTPESAQTGADGKLTSLPAPTRSGYRFNGWFTAASGGTQVTAETVFDADTEIFAQWTKQHSGGGSSASVTYPVTPIEADNGSVTINPRNASKGTIVRITVKPDEGYRLDNITVTDKNTEAVEVTEKGGVYTFTMPEGKVQVTPVFVKDDSEPETPPTDPETPQTDNENPFTDVNEGDYFYDAVLWAVKEKITSGMTDTAFSPNESCTRAQTVTFLWRTEGSPEPNTAENPFTDVNEEDYFFKAVLWAYENGITKGTSHTTFSPDHTVTRGQTVTFLYRMKGEKPNGENPFDDVTVDDYFYDAVLWAYEKNITSGTTDTTFSPGSSCLRGQIVAFLYRAAN